MNISKVQVTYRGPEGVQEKTFVVCTPPYKPVIEVIHAEFIRQDLEVEEVQIIEQHVGFSMQIDGQPLPRSK